MASKVDPVIHWKTPGHQPNGLQATAEGLWVIDQIDPNKVHLLRYEDGSIVQEIQTRGHHASGITLDPAGNIWIASTFGYDIFCIDRAGKELRAFPHPPYDTTGGAHGLEWREGRLWFNVPRLGRIFTMDPADGRIVHSISSHGDRPHGIAWDPYDANLWCVDTNRRVIFKLNPWTGEILDAVGCDGPEPHGMTIWQGKFWICDAGSREVCSFDVPRP